MLRNTHVPRRQKLLISIFSVIVFVIIVAIVRVASVNSTERILDLSWFYFWSNVEMTTGKSLASPSKNLSKTGVRITTIYSPEAAIVIACVASFRQLFVNANKQRKIAKASSRRGLLSYFRLRPKSTEKGKPAANGQDAMTLTNGAVKLILCHWIVFMWATIYPSQSAGLDKTRTRVGISR